MISLGATVVLAGLVLLCKTADDRGKAVPAVSGSAEPPWMQFAKPERSGLKLERYRNNFDKSFSAAEESSASLLGSRIQKCAAAVLKDILPEKSELLDPLEVALLDEYSAAVTCRAVIFAADGKDERRLKCRIRINYLADGSCEAEYPEFFSDK